MHEPARQQQNYKNMRKVFSGKTGDSGSTGPINPYEEEDIGKRFALLKDQMQLQENSSALENNLQTAPTPGAKGPGMPAPPLPNRKTRDYSEYQTVGGKHV